MFGGFGGGGDGLGDTGNSLANTIGGLNLIGGIIGNAISSAGGGNNCPNTSLYGLNLTTSGMKDNIKNPIVRSANKAAPRIQQSICQCLNPDGSVNSKAIQYNGRCITCPSANQVFYSKGLTASDSAGSGVVVSPRIKYGNYTGQNFSSCDIPTAFADDHEVTPGTVTTPTRLPSLTSGSRPTTGTQAMDLIQGLYTTQLQAYKDALKAPINHLYTILGTERRLTDTIPTTGLNALGCPKTTTDNGICVGTCDNPHSLHDPIQMYYDAIENVYVLYGTTCYDSTQKVFDLPAIPAIYTPAVGSQCNENYVIQGSQCMPECPTTSIDNGTSCTTTTQQRKATSPTYTCVDRTMTLVDNMCLAPCPAGTVANGEYCVPAATTVDLPLAGSASGSVTPINCRKTSYGYSGSSTVNKWLCDSQEDMTALLKGQTGSNNATTPYVNPNDIVCVADDPTTGMYYCQGVKDTASVLDPLRTDYSTTCDKLTKGYLDLSNNLTLLSTTTSAATSSATQVANIQTTLTNIYKSICVVSGVTQNSSLCTTLNGQLGALNANINAGSSTSSNVLQIASAAFASRDTLLAHISTLQCSI